MTFLNKIKSYIDKCLFILLFFIVSSILVCICLQVFSRYLLKHPFVFTEELVRFLLIWLGLFGASYTFGRKGHIALTLILDKFKGNLKKIVNILINILVLIFSVLVLTIGGFKLILITKTQLSSVLTIPIWWVYIVAPISGIITTFYQLYFMLLNLLNKGEQQ
ncbi:TRAP transporter small permease [Brachyspira sp.]|uniref:TRAP transporter small permease n=1 Tax=Brachyspira sp. TaxID=1977261 RepID=UPI00263A238E|nr:TRAP transporter small permease [Brachyspira sp.]